MHICSQTHHLRHNLATSTSINNNVPWLFLLGANQPQHQDGGQTCCWWSPCCLPLHFDHMHKTRVLFTLWFFKGKTREAFLSVSKSALFLGFFFYQLFCRGFTVNRTNKNRSGLIISLYHLELDRCGLTKTRDSFVQA